MAGVLRIGSRIALNAVLHKPLGFRVPAHPAAYGLKLRDPERRERAEAILREFFLGVETALRRPAELERMAAGVAPLFWPFFWEGAAMGQEAAYRLPFFRGTPLDEASVREAGRFLFLRVVGVGFLMGFLRPRDTGGISRAAARFGNLGPLVYDGLGFQAGMFRWRGNVASVVRPLLDRFSGAERESALHGLGRSLWFRFMDDPQSGFEAIRAAPESTADLLGGFGLAAAFTWPDRLSVAYELAGALEGDEARALAKGIRVALFVRDCDQRDWLAAKIASLPHLAGRVERDLEVARRVDAETRDLPDYISRFHAGCAEA